MPRAPAGFEILEDIANGSLVGTVSASDLDLGVDGEFTLSIAAESHAGFFHVAQDGKVTCMTTFDREVESFFIVTLQVTDKGARPLSSTTTVFVTLLDVNDNPPVVRPSEYDDQVPEDALFGTAIATIHATDADIGENADLTFVLTAGNEAGKFSIDEDSGDVTVAGTLDAEDTQSYTLTITV